MDRCYLLVFVQEIGIQPYFFVKQGDYFFHFFWETLYMVNKRGKFYITPIDNRRVNKLISNNIRLTYKCHTILESSGQGQCNNGSSHIIKPQVTESHSNLPLGRINFLPFVRENFQPEEAP